MNICQALTYGNSFLKKKNNNNPILDTEILLSYALKIERVELIKKSQDLLTDNERNLFLSYLNRRKINEPISYILEKKEFWSIDFFIQRGVLIPRPETELLIENILKIKKKNYFYNILEIGSGSGCIIISLLKELKFSKGIGIEISKKAIQISRKNAKQLKVDERLKFLLVDFEKFKTFQKFDIIISNPPYIPEYKIKSLSEDIKRFEPKSALIARKLGFEYLEKIIKIYKKSLKKNGILAIEIGDNQFKNVSQILDKNGFRILIKSILVNKQVRNFVAIKL